MDASAHHLVFHGTIILVIGLLCGAPYGRAINRKAPAHTIHAWRIAHLSLPIGAVLMFAVSALMASFAVISPVKWFIAIALIVSGYGFCFALPLGAVVGHRGLSSRGPMMAKLVYGGNLVGAYGSLIAALALVYAAFVSL